MIETEIHQSATLRGDDPACWGHRDDVIEFCDRHGVDANDVAEVTVVSPRMVAFVIYERDASGRRYAVDKETGGPLRIARDAVVAVRKVHKRLVGELPAWWAAA